MKKTTLETSKGSLLDNFLGEYVVMYLVGLNTEAHSDTESVNIPLVVEGIFYDYDSKWILLGNSEQDAFTMINQENVGKIDFGDQELPEKQKIDPKDFN